MKEKCEHIKELEEHMRRLEIRVWAENAEEPDGWVNIHCAKCGVWEDALGDGP